MSDSVVIREAEEAGYIIGWTDGEAWYQPIFDQRGLCSGFKTLEEAAYAAIADAATRCAPTELRRCI